MAASCPVSFIKVDEHQVRTHALLVSILAMLFVASGSVWVLAVLLYDFAVRVLIAPKYSLLFQTSRGLVLISGMRIRPVDAGPKMFAAKIGFAFVTAGTFLTAADLMEPSLWLLTVMALFAALEAAYGFCVGCKMYTLLSPLFSRR